MGASELIFTFRAAIVLVLGFFLPGYLLARLLGVSQRWTAALILSLLLLFQVIFLAGIAGVPLRATTIGGIELALVVVLGLACFLTRRRVNEPEAQIQTDISTIHRWLLLLIAIACAALAVRLWLWPLSGVDHPFRWNYLATQILHHQSIAFYPPFTAADFQIYGYPDAIPPLVSFSLWWIQAQLGSADGHLAAFLYAAQFVAILRFTFALGALLESPAAGMYATIALASSWLFIQAVGIMQETGLTALSLLGVMYYLVQGSRDPHWKNYLVAGACAALGALSREYGVVFIAVGALAAFQLRSPRRMILVFLITALALSMPWYIRNWIRTGNPLYSQALLGLPVNPLYAEVLAFYRSELSVLAWKGRDFASAATKLLSFATIPVLAGAVGLVRLRRRCSFLIAPVVAVVSLWVWSIGYTAGGAVYSMRVLSPALALLSVAGGIWLASCTRWRAARDGAMLCAAVLAIATVLIHPMAPTRAWLSDLRTMPLQRRPDLPQWWEAVPHLIPAGSRVLTTDCYVQAGLTDTTLQPVIVWSPEVSFLLDHELPPAEARKRMLGLNIRYMVLSKTRDLPFYMQRVRLFAEDRANWKALPQPYPAAMSIYELVEDHDSVP